MKLKPEVVSYGAGAGCKPVVFDPGGSIPPLRKNWQVAELVQHPVVTRKIGGSSPPLPGFFNVKEKSA